MAGDWATRLPVQLTAHRRLAREREDRSHRRAKRATTSRRAVNQSSFTKRSAKTSRVLSTRYRPRNRICSAILLIGLKSMIRSRRRSGPGSTRKSSSTSASRNQRWWISSVRRCWPVAPHRASWTMCRWYVCVIFSPAFLCLRSGPVPTSHKPCK